MDGFSWSPLTMHRTSHRGLRKPLLRQLHRPILVDEPCAIRAWSVCAPGRVVPGSVVWREPVDEDLVKCALCAHRVGIGGTLRQGHCLPVLGVLELPGLTLVNRDV